MGIIAPPLSAPGHIDRNELALAVERAIARAHAAGTGIESIEAALDSLHEDLGGASVAGFVLEHGLLWLVAARGYAMIPDGLPLDAGVIGRAVCTCEPQLVVDVSADPDYFTVLPDVASEIALPLISEELGIVGVLDIETRSRLPADSLDVVRPLAVALTSAIDEIREGRTIDLSSLVRLFVHMSTLRDSSVIAGVATRSLGRVLPIETSQLLIADDDGGLVEAARWRAAEEGPEPLNQAALRALRARIDTSAVFELLDTSMMGVPELVGAQARSVVLIPLRANGSEFGLLVGTSRLAEATRHAMRNVDFGEEAAYLIADFPLTQQVLETKTARSISFLDDDLDQAEAFVLRELQMNSCLLVPLVVAGRSWGLVEVYDMRMRRFTPDDEALAMFLTGQAGRRIEALGEARPLRSRLPLFRLPPQ